jgi:prophage antirepressor-like protein
MKSDELITFENPVIGTIRGFIDKNGEPWFLAAQVCRCLGIKDASTAISQLKQRMKVVEDYYKNRGITSSYSPNRGTVSNRSPNCGVKTISLQEGKTHTQLTIINEQWLYELIFASRKQTAIVFRAWVTGEVLPSLRKHGEYRMQGKLIRRSLTDTIKDSGENDKMHGHAYSNYTRLIYKAMGLPQKVDRSALDSDTLEKIARKENLVSAMINEEKSYEEIKKILLEKSHVKA